MKITTKLAGLALAATAMAATMPGYVQPSVAMDKIKIGAVMVLSGGGSVIGKEIKNGMDLAVESLGGKMAGKDVEVLYEDSQRKPDVGKQAADKLVRSEKVDIMVGAAFSNVLLAMEGSVTRRGKILISPNAGAAPLAGKKCSPYFFSASFQNDQSSEAMGKYMTDKGIKTAFVMAPNYQAGRDIIAGFKREFKGEIVGEVLTPLDQKDFSTELSTIASKSPEAVFVFYPGGLGIQYVKQYAQAGLKEKTPLYTSFVIGAATNGAIGDAAQGVFGAGLWAVDLENDANKKFVADYRAKYGKTPSEYAAQGYDTVNLIASAMEKVGGDSSDVDAMRTAVKAADFSSVRGNFKFNTNQYPIHDQHLLVVEKDKDTGELLTVAQEVIVKDMPDSYASQCSN